MYGLICCLKFVEYYYMTVQHFQHDICHWAKLNLHQGLLNNQKMICWCYRREGNFMAYRYNLRREIAS